MRCLWMFHKWQPMKWGSDLNLDCHECIRCHRFEIVAFGRWYSVNRFAFPDARPIETERVSG